MPTILKTFGVFFKPDVIGIYRYVSPKHLHGYTTEFVYRYNNRKDSEILRS
jgi:hypothetical protein